jgi:hypothetical protein
VVLESVSASVDLGDTVTKTEIDAAEMEQLIRKEHTHVWIFVSETEATCEENGERVEKCSVCNDEKRTIIPATEHIWERVGYKEPTDTEDGEATFKCRVCGKTKTEVISAKFVFKGLDTIAELLGDGSFTIDLANNMTVKQTSLYGNTTNMAINVKYATVVLNSKDGHLVGTLECKVEVINNRNDSVNSDKDDDKDKDNEQSGVYKEDVTFKGKIDGDVITAYATENGSQYFAYAPVQALIEMLLDKMPTEELPTVEEDLAQTVIEKVFERLDGKFDVKNTKFTVSEINIINMFFDATEDGTNTLYTFNPENIEKTGALTVEEFIDKVFGNEKQKDDKPYSIYAQLKDLVYDSLEKTAINAMLDFITFAVENNLSEEDIQAIFEIAQDVYAEVSGNETFNLV